MSNNFDYNKRKEAYNELVEIFNGGQDRVNLGPKPEMYASTFQGLQCSSVGKTYINTNLVMVTQGRKSLDINTIYQMLNR